MTYPGGKSGDGVYQKIICEIPPHDLYIEPFLGGGAILRKKRPAAASIAIDRDVSAINQVAAWGIPNCTVIVADALDYLARFGPGLGQKAFVYLDPPYLFSVRKSQRPIYKHEFGTQKEHQALLDLIKSLRCMVAISGYWSQQYDDALDGWRMITFPAQTRSGETAQECLWMNYDSPVMLHDYRYLGSNYRERERIKRQQKRWRNRLVNMPPAERFALLSVIADLYPQ